MDLLSSLFWADETWLSAKPPFKVVTKHQPPNRPWLHMSHVASWHQVGCRHPDHSASLWWPLPGRKWNRCGWNGGGGGVFRCWLFWSVSRSKLKETQKNMLYTFPKLEMCFSKNPFSWNYGFSFLQQQGLNLPLKSFSWVGIFCSLPRRHQRILFLNLTSCKKIPNWQTHPWKSEHLRTFGPV